MNYDESMKDALRNALQRKSDNIKSRLYKVTSSAQLSEIKAHIDDLLLEAAELGISLYNIQELKSTVELKESLLESVRVGATSIDLEKKFNSDLELLKSSTINLEYNWLNNISVIADKYIEELDKQNAALKAINENFKKGETSKDQADYISKECSTEKHEMREQKLTALVNFSSKVNQHYDHLSNMCNELSHDLAKEQDAEKKLLKESHFRNIDLEKQKAAVLKEAVNKKLKYVHKKNELNINLIDELENHNKKEQKNLSSKEHASLKENITSLKKQHFEARKILSSAQSISLAQEKEIDGNIKVQGANKNNRFSSLSMPKNIEMEVIKTMQGTSITQVPMTRITNKNNIFPTVKTIANKKQFIKT